MRKPSALGTRRLLGPKKFHAASTLLVSSGPGCLPRGRVRASDARSPGADRTPTGSESAAPAALSGLGLWAAGAASASQLVSADPSRGLGQTAPFRHSSQQTAPGSASRVPPGGGTRGERGPRSCGPSALAGFLHAHHCLSAPGPVSLGGPPTKGPDGALVGSR